MPTTLIYSYSVTVADTRGLDPQQFRVTLLVDREDGKPLSKTDREAITAAFAEAPPEAPPTRTKATSPKPAASSRSPPTLVRPTDAQRMPREESCCKLGGGMF
jgi:hypothetical protein